MKGNAEARKKAIEDFTQAIRLNPEYGAAYEQRGIAIWKTLPPPKWGDALSDLDRAITFTPENPSLYYSRGCIRYDVAVFDGAIADFSEALRRSAALTGREGSAPDMYYARGRALEKKGDIAAAIADYEDALKYAPADWYLRGRMEEALKQARSKR